MRAGLAHLAVLLAVALSIEPAASVAQHHVHADLTQFKASADVPIQITINPEARVSVLWRGPMPPTSTCGHALDLQVKIINQGFVTAPIEVLLVGSMNPDGITLDFPVAPLNGAHEELRTLRVTLNSRGLFDVTIAFRAKGDFYDPDGRDRIHLLLRCTE